MSIVVFFFFLFFFARVLPGSILGNNVTLDDRLLLSEGSSFRISRTRSIANFPRGTLPLFKGEFHKSALIGSTGRVGEQWPAIAVLVVVVIRWCDLVIIHPRYLHWMCLCLCFFFFFTQFHMKTN